MNIDATAVACGGRVAGDIAACHGKGAVIVDAAAVHFGRITSERAAIDGSRSLINNGTAAVGCRGVVGEGSSIDGKRHAGCIIDGSGIVSRIARDGTTVDGQDATIVDGTAAVAGRAALDGAAAHGHRAGVVDRAAVGGRAVMDGDVLEG